jgi:uncharacterized protein
MSARWHQLIALPQQSLILLVRGYRFFLSPWLGNACRFEPTCSVYSLQALQAHGALVGSYLTLARLARCHPWCAAGVDPVPTQVGLFTRLDASALPHKARPAFFSRFTSRKKTHP